jgi:hypothetical protein
MDMKPLVKTILARNQEVLESTMADVQSEHAHWAPPGKALPRGALYVHSLTAEDFFIQGLLKGGAPQWESSWTGRMGRSEPRPPRGQPWDDWARRVRIDLPALREYGQAVYAATDAYIDGLSEPDLAREIEFMGRKMALAALFLGVVCTHCANYAGPVSTPKGLQGLKGYPF